MKLKKFIKTQKDRITVMNTKRRETVIFVPAEMIPFLFQITKNPKRLSIVEAAISILVSRNGK